MVTSFGNTVADFPQDSTPQYNDIIYLGQKQTDGTFTDQNVTQQDLTKLRVITKTAIYTIASNDDVILADATNGAFTVTLPSAVGLAGIKKIIKKIDSSSNHVTIGTTSAQTIDGAATQSLNSQWNKIIVVSDGTNWLVIG